MRGEGEMGSALGRCFVEQAFRNGIPAAALHQKCKNWGIGGGQAVILVEEAAAEAHSRLLDRTFENEDHYKNSVIRTAINIAVDMLRRQNRACAVPLVDELAADPKDADTDPSLLAEGLATLSDRERNILRMTYEEGLTLDEIAARILPPSDKSLNAQRLRVKRERDLALQRLRKYLIGRGFDADEPEA